MQRLVDLIGSEHPLDFSARAMRDFARGQGAAMVGALHVTCSDESERECVESFQHNFAAELLPALKYSAQSPFRTASLGGRYEWGSASLAEDHFNPPHDEDGGQFLLMKINAHVAVTREGSDFRYGTMDRYNEASQFCGALHAVLDGRQLPAIRNLAEAFRSEGLDRIAMLNDPSQVDPHYRSLLAAVASARLQARRAVLDIQNTPHADGTRIVVLPCVTMNRIDRDTELIVGLYHSDFRGGKTDIRYRGLGDDPSKYQVTLKHNMVIVADDHLGQDRQARDHRRIVLDEWRSREGEVLIDDDKLNEIVVLSNRASPSSAVSKEVLKTLLRLLADVALVPTAVTLFVDGIAGIHNIYRAYRLASGHGTPQDATSILDETLARVDGLSPQQARGVIAKLCHSYGITLAAGDEEDIAPATVELRARPAIQTKPQRELPAASQQRDDRVELSSRAPVRDAPSAAARTSQPTLSSALAGSSDMMEAPSMELELGAGNQLEFSSMPPPELSLSQSATLGESTLGQSGSEEYSFSSEAPSPKSRIDESSSAARSDVSAIVDTKPIVDVSKDVTAIETPEIAADAGSIVDTAKDVTGIDTPEIATAAPQIKPPSEAIITSIETPQITQAPLTPAPQMETAPQPGQPTEIKPFAIDRFESPSSTPKTAAPLRQPHVVQPDEVIEAELIPIDGDEDAIIILDDTHHIR